MNQISNKIYCDDSLEKLDIPTKLLPNPYRDYPYLIIENFLDASICQEIVDAIKKSQNGLKAKVKSSPAYGVVEPKVIEEYRKTNIYKLHQVYESVYQNSFLSHQKEIEEFFNISLTLSTDLQALEYTKGGFYIKHADDSNELIDSDGNIAGFLAVSPERKLTTVLFVTAYDEIVQDNYTFSGGELLFNYLYDEQKEPIKLKPKIGSMVIFFSNPYFSHEVLPVNDGYRLTLVQWHNGIVI
jgi:SM-20-related protein